jgi:hypothetical protein
MPRWKSADASPYRWWKGSCLQVLSAEQQSKFAGANQDHGSVSEHNFGKNHLKSKASYGAVLCSAANLRPDTMSTVFLLSSPQILAKLSSLTTMLGRQERRRVIWLAIIDEVRPYVQQGTTFRNRIRKLTTTFFLKVFSK